MRLLVRVAFILLLLTFMWFAAWMIHIRHIEADHVEFAAMHELRLLSAGVERAVEQAWGVWSDEGALEPLRETVEVLERANPRSSIVLYDLEGDPVLRGEDAFTGEAWLRELIGYAVGSAEEHTAVDRERSLAVAIRPVDVHGAVVGHLAVVVPLAGIEADERRIRMRGLLGMVGLIVTNLVASLLIGWAWIALPLRHLRTALERMRDGDLSVTVAHVGHDELQRVISVANELARELAASRATLERQALEKQDLLAEIQQSDKLASIGQLSAGLAHEIGGPLQVLRGRIEHLRNHVHDPERVLQLTEILEKQLARITRIVSLLLDYAGRSRADRVECSLSEPVEAVVDLLRIEARRAGVRLRYDGAPAPMPRIRANTDQIQQIVFNLLTNSFSHTRPGDEVVVRVLRAEAGELDSTDERGVALEIEDTGEGMDEETIRRIYEPFFTRGGRRVGHGLGMPIVRRIVEENEGKIDIRSTPGKGSRIRVVFPACPADPEER